MKSVSVVFALNLSLYACIIGDQVKQKDELLRSKRQINSLPLVYPYGGTYKLILGMIAPVHSEEYANLVFGINFQYQYLQVQNITEVSQYYAFNTISREQRELRLNERKNERLVFYKAVEELLSAKGFDGPECMKRAVCEAAQYPVKEEALIGEIMHILLTPNYGKSPFEDEDVATLAMSDYMSAHTAGEQMFDCANIYERCPEGEGVMELISELRDD